MMAEPTAEQVLEKAVDILSDPERWRQGAYSDESGQAFCSVGALRVAACLLGGINRLSLRQVACFGPVFETGFQYRRAMNALEWVLFEDYGTNNVPEWNDDSSRKHEEIVAVFEKARAFAAEKGW